MTRTRWGALGAAACAAALLTFWFAVELVRRDFVLSEVPANYVTALLAIVLGTLAIGVMVARRQSNVGVALVAAAVGIGLGYWRFSVHPWPAALGFAITSCTPLFPLHAAMLHGEGIPVRPRRALVGVEGAVALVGLTALFSATDGTIDRWFVAAEIRWYVANPALIVDAPTVARVAYAVWWVMLIAAGVIFTTARIRVWRGEPGAARRANAPVVWAAAAWTVLIGCGAAMLFIRRDTLARNAVADFGAILLPALGAALVAAAIGWVELVRPRLGRVHAGNVEMRSIEPEDTPALRRLLADVLATRKVDVVFAAPDGWVDDTGRRAEVPSDARRVTVVRRNGEPVAAVIHDPDVSFEALELAARLVGGHLDAQRATALARARAEAVRDAAGHLVRAGDRAATDVGVQLVAGPVAALDALVARLGVDSGAVSAAPGVLRAVTAEVRSISHGVFPRDIDQGLHAILAVPGTPARRLPPTVEMTVYLLAQSEGALIRDEGDCITVERSASIPVALAERVGALGGRVDGTVAEVPVEG